MGSTGFGWLYLFVGWAWRGATPGQKLWRIRVVAVDGSRLTIVQALRRCLGYALSIVPLKPGLWPIFRHPLRQGWHDRIAGTLVVCEPLPASWPETISRDKPPAGGVETPKQSFADLPVPHLKRPLRSLLPVLLAYTLLAIGMTYPLVLHFSTHMAGVPGDSEQFSWNYWHAAQAFRGRDPLLQTDFLFYPERVSLAFHTMNWVHCMVSIPLQMLFSLTATYNLLLIGTLVACALSLYWLLGSLTRDLVTSFIVAPVFGFSPYFMAHGLGHMNLISAQFIVLFALFFYAALVKPAHAAKVACTVAAGICLALAGYCDWYYFVFSLALGVAVGIGVAAKIDGNAGRLRCLTYGATAVAIGIFLLCPLLIPTLQERVRGGYNETSLSILTYFQGDLADYLLSSPLHFSLGVTQDPAKLAGTNIEKILTPGYTVMGLALVSLYFSRRRLSPWITVLVTGLVLSFGFNLTVWGHAAFNQGMLLAVSGAPGAGFASPWDTGGLLTLAQHMVATPSAVLTDQAAIPMPFAWIPTLVPPLKILKVTARFGLIALLACAVLAAFALVTIRQYYDRKGRPAFGIIFSGICLATILWEYLIVPYPIHETPISRFYYKLGQQKEKFAIVEVPLRSNLSVHQYYQTVHHKPIFAGTLSRQSPYFKGFIDQNPLLTCFNAWDSQAMRNIGALSTPDLNRSLDSLRSVKARYIVIHKVHVTKAEAAALNRLLGGRGHLPIVHDDKDIRVFQIATHAQANAQ